MRLLSITIGSAALLAVAAADTITLKSGRVIEGTYLGGTARTVRFAIGNQIQVLNVNEVSKIEFNGSAPSKGAAATEPPGARNALFPSAQTLNTANAVAPAVGASTSSANEADFIAVLGSLKARYKAVPNEFQKSAVRRERAAALARILPNLSVDGWLGKISSMATTGSGDGVLTVHPIGCDWITIKTWNNSISDVSSGTLIPAGSSLYEQVSHRSLGDKVMFSGRFIPSVLDYLKESSLTEAGSMNEPEFIFMFLTVRPADK